MSDLINRSEDFRKMSYCNLYDEIVTDLESIWDKLWEIDIPSPTIPEYIEHHEQVRSVMKYVTNLSHKYADKYRHADKRRIDDERQQ